MATIHPYKGYLNTEFHIYAKGTKLVDKNHVARRGHRQPLCDALDEAKERRF